MGERRDVRGDIPFSHDDDDYDDDEFLGSGSW
jgi:hypothetical protein